MDKSQDYLDLVDKFERLGARDPEVWAQSEVDEGIAQLARYCFLRRIWPAYINRWLDTAWIDDLIKSAEQHPEGPFADTGYALKRLIGLGATPQDIAHVARRVAYSTAFGLLYHLDLGVDLELGDEFPGWRLVETDAENLTGREVGALYESILSMDPSGREGRPVPNAS